MSEAATELEFNELDADGPPGDERVRSAVIYLSFLFLFPKALTVENAPEETYLAQQHWAIGASSAAVPLMGGSWMGATSNPKPGAPNRGCPGFIHRGPGTFKIHPMRSCQPSADRTACSALRCRSVEHALNGSL